MPPPSFLFSTHNSNIAGDSSAYRDAILAAGAAPRLAEMAVTEQKLTMVRNAAWAMSNLCRGKPQPAFDLVSGTYTADDGKKQSANHTATKTLANISIQNIAKILKEIFFTMVQEKKVESSTSVSTTHFFTPGMLHSASALILVPPLVRLPAHAGHAAAPH